MVQSSNYKVPDRQPRILTEESAFAGGMYWTDNNIDAMHLKSIVNFNYDETTGFLKTRGALLPEAWYNEAVFDNKLANRTELISAAVKIPGLYKQELIGVYNVSPTVVNISIDENKHKLYRDTDREPSGRLYLFGTPLQGNQTMYEESSFVWLFLDSENKLHQVNCLYPETVPSIKVNNKPVLYDNSVYFNNLTADLDETDKYRKQAFIRYQLFKHSTNYTCSASGDGVSNTLVLPCPTFYIPKQGVGPYQVYINGELQSKDFYKYIFRYSNNSFVLELTFDIAPAKDAEIRVALTEPQAQGYTVDRQRYSNDGLNLLENFNCTATISAGTKGVVIPCPEKYKFPNKIYNLYLDSVEQTPSDYSYRFVYSKDRWLISIIFNKPETITDDTAVLVLLTPDIMNIDTLFDTDYKHSVNNTTLVEATTTGFNALKGFKYESTLQDPNSEAVPRIQGIYAVDEAGKVCVNPRIGQQAILNFILQDIQTDPSLRGNVTLYKLEQGDLKDPQSLWTKVATVPVTTDPVFVKYIFTSTQTTFRLDWDNGKPEGELKVYDSQVVTYNTSNINKALNVKEYAVNTAKSSCLWNNHLVLWNIHVDTNMLFISEVDNFYYFPIPNNAVSFDTDVMSCVNYMGSLLVFTADKIWRVSETKEGTFTQEVIQSNMPVSKDDAPYVCAIKNMIFFKSGKYYYMLVPKAQSLTGELVVAPIYKNISKWFDDSVIATKEIVSEMYPENYYDPKFKKDNKMQSYDFTVSDPIEVYVEQDTVTIMYNITAYYTTTKLDDEGDTVLYPSVLHEPKLQLFTLFLNYNTNLRAWTMHLVDVTDGKLYPTALHPAREMSFLKIIPSSNTNEPSKIIQVCAQDLSNNPKHQLIEDLVGVRCLIDTGYRTLSTSFKKRFREVQLKLCSQTENITTFGTAFLLDGQYRRTYSHLTEVYNNDKNKVQISLAPVYDPNTFVTESTCAIDTNGNVVINEALRGSDSIELSDWTLDFSHFKRNAPLTIRIPVSGKGFSPRLIFLSTKCLGLSLNNINWIYRMMSGR